MRGVLVDMERKRAPLGFSAQLVNSAMNQACMKRPALQSLDACCNAASPAAFDDSANIPRGHLPLFPLSREGGGERR
jgi:hypothetical protein